MSNLNNNKETQTGDANLEISLPVRQRAADILKPAVLNDVTNTVGSATQRFIAELEAEDDEDELTDPGTSGVPEITAFELLDHEVPTPYDLEIDYAEEDAK